METETLRISIALCTFNGGRFLQQQLASLRDQTRLPDELVVGDDGSTDDTRRLLEAFAATSPFPVQVEINPRRLDAPANFERTIQRCAGDVIFPCDQDDIWHARKVQRLADALEEAPRCLVAFCDLAIIDDRGGSPDSTQWQTLGFDARARRAFRHAPFCTLLRRNVVSGAAMAFRRELLEFAWPVGEAWLHDEWLGVIAAAVADVAMVEEPLIAYRQHADQAIGAAPQRLLAQWRWARDRMGRDYFARLVQRDEALVRRLRELGSRVPKACLSQAQDRLRHDRHRLRMREPGVWRAPGVARELLRGGYRHFAYGWKSAAQDLLLR